MIIFKIRIFKLSDIDQGIYKHVIQKKYEFLACLKKVIQRKGKKSHFCVSRTTLCRKILKLACKIFFGKVFSYKIRFAVEKKKQTKFGAISILLVAINKMLVIQFSYMEIV